MKLGMSLVLFCIGIAAGGCGEDPLSVDDDSIEAVQVSDRESGTDSSLRGLDSKPSDPASRSPGSPQSGGAPKSDASTDPAIDAGTPEKDPRPATDASLIGDRLRQYALARITETILQRRAVAPPEEDIERLLAEFERRVLALPMEIAAAYSEEQDEREVTERALETGDGAELLAQWAANQYEPPDSVDTEWIQRSLAPRPVRTTLPGRRLTSSDDPAEEPIELEDGTTIEFGAGVFELDSRILTRQDPFPSDITIQGAGIDSTLLRLTQDLGMRSNVERLRLQNLTIDGRNDGIFDLRMGSLVLEMEGVRVVGFDAGHGGSYVFAVSGGTILQATSCEFLGGYTETPGQGHLFRPTSQAGFLASFRSCRFELHSLELQRITRQNARILFEQCSFELMQDDLSKPVDGVELRDCRVGERYDYQKMSEYQRDLADLFPALR